MLVRWAKLHVEVKPLKAKWRKGEVCLKVKLVF